MQAFLRFLAASALALSLTGCVGVSINTQERGFFAAVGDLNTQAQLNATLLDQSASLFTDVNITVIEGRVYLSGSVPTDEDRIAATRLAWEAPNVKEVVNDLEVNPDADFLDATRDRWITTEVRAKILADSSIRDINYTIDTQNRVVYIFGIAQDEAERDRVLAHARSVARHVVDHAVLKDDPRRVGDPEREVASDSATE